MSLPETYASHDDAGRPTLGAARGFLVRLYMRQAGRMRLSGGNADAKWQQALTAVNEVLQMEGSVYTLQPQIWDVFNPDTDATLYNNELMFAIRANDNITIWVGTCSSCRCTSTGASMPPTSVAP